MPSGHGTTARLRRPAPPLTARTRPLKCWPPPPTTCPLRTTLPLVRAPDAAAPGRHGPNAGRKPARHGPRAGRNLSESAYQPTPCNRLTDAKAPLPGTARCWWSLWRQMRRLAAGRLHGGSALVLPRGFWRGGCCEAVQRGSGPRWLPWGLGRHPPGPAPPGRVTAFLWLKPGRPLQAGTGYEYGPRTSLPSNPRTRTP